MWQQLYDPLGNSFISALVAAFPILFFLGALTVLKLKGLNAAIITLAISVVLVLLVTGMPLEKIMAAAVFGILSGLWPIGYIVLMAVWLYKLAVKSGKFDVIRASIATISDDQRIQVILIAFCFGAFLEGAAGFGVPIAICAALLVELGFKPIKAAMLCLLANAASGAYGAIGIPVLVGAQLGGVELADMSVMMILIIQLSTLFVPLLLILVLDGFRGVRETWPVLLVIGVLFSGLQAAILYALGPELTDIIPPLVSMGTLALFMQFWQPKTIYREEGAPPVSEQRWSLGEVISAWSPFYILTGVILLWSVPQFKSLFAADGPLAATVLKLPIPFLHLQVEELPPIVEAPHALPAVWNVALISAPGTAILISVILTTLLSPTLSPSQAFSQLKATISELWKPLIMISLIMAVAYIANFSGASTSIGLALAQTGRIFPLISPAIGWFGVFITGSVVNNNTLFAHLQAVTATQIGISQPLLVAANTCGGVMAKLISPQSIAIAAAAVGQVGREAEITRTTLFYSFALLVYVSVWTFILSFFV
ncbi:MULTISPECIES: L-lactate permease [unclassified Rhizobium]|uniref:L-lactate permease n=1 Tax=unclassified Rhizobium TaxID=2613769 RepID=UPI00071514CE|nr:MULTISPECIES: lactate permease LctP family transporter [unclassified Rhizobium]KQS88746.1 L-lactate permease [Rhizobium sp. Leaf391]KQT05689.1 L-lactate permease [Rhizobium sp. Leaf386]KQT91414.1 L-lactate permease [Rhizobium sp. Leaf453]